MTIDIKAVAVFLPVLSGCLWGLGYAMSERILSTASISTWFCTFGVVEVGVAMALHFFSPSKIDFSAVIVRPAVIYVLIAVVAFSISWLSLLLVMKNISATYAAIGEISYPFFTALFAYLIFRTRELDWSMAIGGLLILIGSAIVITGKIKTGS